MTSFLTATSSICCREVMAMMQFVLVLVGAPLLLYLMWKAMLVIIYLLVAFSVSDSNAKEDCDHGDRY